MSDVTRLDFVGTIQQSGYAGAPVVFDATISPEGGVFESGVFEEGVFSEAADYSFLPAFSGSVDTAVLDEFFPRIEGRQQIIGRIRIKIDGTELPPDQMLHTFEYSESEEGAITWSFAVPYFSSEETDTGELSGSTKYNDPLLPSTGVTSSINHFHGPPPGGSSVDIDVVTPTASGSIAASLVKDGLVDNAELLVGPEGAIMHVNGTGPLQRLDQKLVSLVIPAGHGLTLGQMVSFVLRETAAQNEDDWDYTLPDIPDFLPIAPDGAVDTKKRYKEIQVTDRPGLEVANELLEVLNYKLVLDAEGEWKLNYLGEELLKTPDWAFDTQHVFADPGLSLAPNVDGPPIVTVQGSSQDVIDDGGGLVQEDKELSIVGDYIRSYPEWEIYDTAGTLSSTGATDDARYGTYYQVFTTLTRQGDTMISERVRVWDLYNREQPAGDIDEFGVATYIVGRKIDDDGRCVYDSYNYLRETAEELTTHTYEDLYSDGREFLTKTEFWKYGYYNRKEATMQYSSGAWEYRDGVDVEWDGDGVYSNREYWELLEYKSTTHTIDEDGFLTSKVTTEDALWDVDPGTKYGYTDGRTSSDSYETWGRVRTITETYSPTDEDTHTKTTTEVGWDGTKITTETNQDGYLPAAAMKTLIKPDELSDGTPLPDSKYASSNLTTEFEGTYVSEALLEHRPSWEHVVTNSVVEDKDEAVGLAKVICKELATIPTDFEIPWNPLVRATDKVEFNVGYAGEYDLGVVTMKVVERQLTYSREDGVAKAVLSGKVHPV